MHMLNIFNASNTNKILFLPCIHQKFTNAKVDIILSWHFYQCTNLNATCDMLLKTSLQVLFRIHQTK